MELNLLYKKGSILSNIENNNTTSLDHCVFFHIGILNKTWFQKTAFKHSISDTVSYHVLSIALTIAQGCD